MCIINLGDIMIFLHRQSYKNSPFLQLGITNSYLEHIDCNSASKTTNFEKHHHTSFEIHFVEKGSILYAANGKEYKVNEGEFLLLPPLIMHQFISFEPGTVKKAIMIYTQNDCPLNSQREITHGNTPEAVKKNFDFIVEENKSGRLFSQNIIEARTFESALLIFRLCGVKIIQPATREIEDPRFIKAISFIKDNIDLNPSVSDTANYCHISSKQLTRIFTKSSNLSPAAYIRKERIIRAKALLSEEKLTMKQISETMNFPSEYNFNSFFKRFMSVPPGEYRKNVLNS